MATSGEKWPDLGSGLPDNNQEGCFTPTLTLPHKGGGNLRKSPPLDGGGNFRSSLPLDGGGLGWGVMNPLTDLSTAQFRLANRSRHPVHDFLLFFLPLMSNVTPVSTQD